MEGAILRVEEVRVVSIRECKIDKGGDLHHGSLPTYTSDFPDLFFLLIATSMSQDPGGRSGIAEVDGSDPPFLPPGSARRGGTTYTRAAPLGRVAPVPKIPAGRQSEGPMKWRHVILILAGPAATISRSEYDPFPRAGDNPVLDLIAFPNPALHAAIEA